MSKRAKIVVPPGHRLIFRGSIMKNGKKILASQYGLRGFPIIVKR